MEIRKLEIRRLKSEELQDALHLIWEVFEKEIKPSYSEDGVQEFLNFIEYSFIKEKYDNGEMIFWGAFEEELIGTVAVRPDGHISLFFVKNEYQGLGIGKTLFQMMYNYCVEELHVKKITVNASPQSVAKYIHMGLRQMGNMEERNGIRSVPMEMYASPTLVKPVRFEKKKDYKKLWVITGIIVALLIGGVIFAGVRTYRTIHKFVMEEDGWDYSIEPNGSELPQIETELTGVEAIEPYATDNVFYEITNESYNFVDDEKINTVIDFSVQYPQLTVKDESLMEKAVLEEINKAIYDCAMETVEKIYSNPSTEIKERVLGAQTPVLVSYVTYKVTYQSDKFISIVMEDQSYHGSQEDYYYDFRTLNIDLSDGSVCEAEELFQINDKFVKDWIMIMRSEAENEKFLSELNKKDLIRALKGDSFGGVYDVEYFFDADGVEIGFAFQYEEGDKNDLGYSWVTAPFTYDEIEKYISNHSIWNEMN